MTFSLRRKHPTTHRAARLRRAATILSIALAALTFLSSAHGQSGDPGQVLTPKFVPSPIAPAHHFEFEASTFPDKIKPASAQLGRNPGPGDDQTDVYVRTDLPGPQRLFLRESETQFFDRIAQNMKKQAGAGRAIFPELPVLSKEPYKPRDFPHMVQYVEPSYVCHRRLYFEQPNFERAGYDFGALQPALGLAAFYYDLALLPYHAFSNLGERGECTVGKCLPGDQAPLLLRRERLSISGLAGQSASVLGISYLFP